MRETWPDALALRVEYNDSTLGHFEPIVEAGRWPQLHLLLARPASVLNCVDKWPPIAYDRKIMRLSLTKAINAFLKPVGYRFSRIPPGEAEPVAVEPIVAVENPNMTTLGAALGRVVERGMEVNTIIDVGASNGQWTEAVKPFFPNAKSLLIEANPVHEESLKQFTQKYDFADYVLSAAGDTTGKIYFDARDPLGGLASHSPLPNPTISVPVTTIDNLIRERCLRPPYLIKLDTHGFEVPILRGAKEALERTNMLIVETYNFQLTPTSLKFYELCKLASSLGFSPIDFCDPLWRVRDKALWQIDILFVRGSRKEFECNTYA